MSSSANGDTQFPIRTLPVTGNLTLLYALSLLVALLLVVASVAGLLDPQRLCASPQFTTSEVSPEGRG